MTSLYNSDFEGRHHAVLQHSESLDDHRSPSGSDNCDNIVDPDPHTMEQHINVRGPRVQSTVLRPVPVSEHT